MPYTVAKQGNKYVVKKKTTDKVFGTHATRAQALKQRLAILINEKKQSS